MPQNDGIDWFVQKYRSRHEKVSNALLEALSDLSRKPYLYMCYLGNQHMLLVPSDKVQEIYDGITMLPISLEDKQILNNFAVEG